MVLLFFRGSGFEVAPDQPKLDIFDELVDVGHQSGKFLFRPLGKLWREVLSPEAAIGDPGEPDLDVCQFDIATDQVCDLALAYIVNHDGVGRQRHGLLGLSEVVIYDVSR